jgi:protein-disulfide isomerase
MSTTLWEAALALPVWPSRDHIRGPIDAAVTLLEYGDYECPYCGAAHAIVSAIQAHMAAELRFVFRHFPMTTIHPHAQPAAEAAEAAGAQGKFWAMHDVLFEHQQQLAGSYLLTSLRLWNSTSTASARNSPLICTSRRSARTS